jgi:hypothetical protein
VVLLVLEVLMLLMKAERRCEFGICLSRLVIYSHFDDFVNFGCHAHSSQLFEPAQATTPLLIVMKPKASAVDVLSSDTEDLLNSLFLSPACDSQSLCHHASFDANSCKSWPEVNDMAVSVYVALMWMLQALASP